MAKLKIAVIIGSTRDSRFGPIPAQWIFDEAKKRAGLDVELVDLKSFNLPLFNEMASNAWMPSRDQHAVAWQNKVGEFDGYIVVTPEYNRSIPASLKNAFDQAYKEWVHKPIAFVGYGTVGAARAIEHARTIAVELQMVPVRSGVHVGGSEFMKVHPGFGGKETMASIEGAFQASAKDMLDQLTWWGDVTKKGRMAG